MGKQIPAKDRVLELWHTDMKNDELAAALGVTRGTLATIRERYDLPSRDHASMRGTVFVPDPTPKEIEERAAAIRAGWSRHQEKSRWLGGPREARVQRFAFDGRNAAFSSMDG